ncbi:MAG: hypothetical protein WCK39_03070 [Methanomassiliicoccales archaeon]
MTEPVNQYLTPPKWMMALVVLNRFPEDDGYKGVFGQTDIGMAAHLNVSRVHACAETNRIFNAGYASQVKRHVDGRKGIIKCSFITAQGREQLKLVLRLYPDIEKYILDNPPCESESNTQLIKNLQSQVSELKRDLESLKKRLPVVV